MPAGRPTSDLVDIYALCDPDTGRVRYVGKARDSRKRLAAHLRNSRRCRTPKDEWLIALASSGKKPTLKVLVQSTDWEADERRLIAEYRASMGDLLNVADGGVGGFRSAERPRGAFFKLMHKFQGFINDGAHQFVALKHAYKSQRKAALRHMSAADYDAWINAQFDGRLS